MHPVSYSNTHHDVTDLVITGWIKIQKLEHLENETSLFYETKKILTCATDSKF